MRRHETPIKRINPSGNAVWVARWTNRQGQRRSAGTYDLKRDAQDAIDAAYDRENTRPARMTDTLGGYAALWPSVHPRSKRTNDENKWRIGVVLAMEIEGVELRHWVMSDVRRRHALAVQANLLDQGRAAEGATGILRAMSAMTNDAIDDEVCETNPWLRLGVRVTDPRVQRAPRAKRMWSIEQMHGFAAAAARVRDDERDEPTELERWRRVYVEPMIRVLSDCGLRLGAPAGCASGAPATRPRPRPARRRRTTCRPTSRAATCACRPRSRRCCTRCRAGSTRRCSSPPRPGWSGASATGVATCGRPRRKQRGWTHGRRSSERRGSRSCAPLGSTPLTSRSTQGTVSRRRTVATCSRSTGARSACAR
jgi:hypothetical protein